jgi:hypothetical protein
MDGIDMSRLQRLEDRAADRMAVAYGLSERRREARERHGRARVQLQEAQEFAAKAHPSLAQRIGRPGWPLGQGRALEKGEKVPMPTLPERWLEEPGLAGLRDAVREEQEAREALDRIERQHDAAGARAAAANDLLRRCREYLGRGETHVDVVAGGAKAGVQAAAQALRAGGATGGYSLPPAARHRWGGAR